MQNNTHLQYLEAKKHVKMLKGFYVHAFIYVIVNLFIIADNIFDDHHSIMDMDNYWTPILWGLGLAIHGLSVFMPNFIFGKDWEDKKIKELMNNGKK